MAAPSAGGHAGLPSADERTHEVVMQGKHDLRRRFGGTWRVRHRGAPRAGHGRRLSLMPVADAAAWVFGVVAAVLLRYDVDLAHVDLRKVALVAAVAVAVHLTVGPWAGLYVG